MINWFKRGKFSEYKQALIESFPGELESELIEVFKVIPFHNNRSKNFYYDEYSVSRLISEDKFEVVLNKERCKVPYRVYFSEPHKLKKSKLTMVQKDLLNCIYSRHHNGRIRQQSLEKLNRRNAYWITPFRVQLLGEYVYEILETLSIQLEDQILDNCKLFMEQNPEFAQKTKDRVISYYGVFYKWRHPNFKNYLGNEIIKKINQRHIGVNQAEIVEIGVDEEKHFYIKHKKKDLPLLNRFGEGKYWKRDENYIHSTAPKEWGYYKIYLDLIYSIYKECNIELISTKQTELKDLDRKSKNQIRQNKKRPT